MVCGFRAEVLWCRGFFPLVLLTSSPSISVLVLKKLNVPQEILDFFLHAKSNIEFCSLASIYHLPFLTSSVDPRPFCGQSELRQPSVRLSAWYCSSSPGWWRSCIHVLFSDCFAHVIGQDNSQEGGVVPYEQSCPHPVAVGFTSDL